MIKFYLKVMLKSPIFIMSMLFTIFIMMVQISALNSSIHLYARINFYGYISFNLFLLLSCTYVMNKKYELAEFLERNLFKKFIYTFFTSIVISSLVFILPMLVIIIYKWNKISFIDFYQGIFNYFILWSLSNCLSALIGCTIGILVRKWYSYIISFILYLGYISYIYGPPKSVLDRLMCVFSDNIFINQNNLAPILFNASYYLDKCFIILFIIAIINLVYLTIGKKKISLISLISLFTIIGLLVSIIPISSKLSKIGTESYNDFYSEDYIIQDYKMNLEIKSILKNSCEVDIKIINATSSITFMLDDIFKINSIVIGDEYFKFEHKNNQVKIDSNFEQNQIIKIRFDYSGFVDVSNYLGVNTYYVNNQYINLPNKKFYWYPLLNTNTIHNFNVNISSDTDIYSNLEPESMDKNRKEYELSGSDFGFSIFAGDYKVVTNNNISYIIPRNYKIDFLESYLDNLSERILDKNVSSGNQEKSNILKNKLYKKVIVGEWYSNAIEDDLGNEIHFYDDTIIINLGV